MYVPVLVESTKNLIVQETRPSSGKSTKTTGGLNVTNNTNNHHGGALQDGNCLNDFLLVDLGTDLVDLTDDVGHTSLVTQESSQVGLDSSAIAGEGLNLASESSSALSGEKAQGSVSGC